MMLVRRGKVKDIYTLDDKKLLFHFTDRVSAFDIVLPTPIPRKGEVLARFAKFFFERLGVRHHMLDYKTPNSLIVKRLKMIPIEFVVRGYLYGSLYERVRRGEVKIEGVRGVLAEKLPYPLLDPTTKSDIKDLPITTREIVERGILGEDEIRFLEKVSISIYEKIAKIADAAGFILADLKIEFGFDESGEILLADSIGPDEFRLWPKEAYEPGKPQESFDKQLIRDWLTEIGYKRAVDEARRNNLPMPEPPELPTDLVMKVSNRYIEAYERMTGERLR
jgi:phosphoribosylaminoimidazole-succinocarboxamide synthase